MQKELPEIIDVELEYCLEEYYDAGYNGRYPRSSISERLKAIILVELEKAKNATNQD